MESKKPTAQRSVVVFGLAGKGKSSILNTLISGDPNSQVFRAAKSKKAVTTQVDFADSEIFGMNSPNVIYRFFDVPGLLGGEQTFSSWSKDFIQKLGTSKVSLVLLVMSKDDRMDDASKLTWATVKDIFKAIAPGQVVLILTRCEDGLDKKEQAESMQEVNDFFGEGTVQERIIPFKILKDQAKQMKFVELFNAEVFTIIGDAPRPMNVNPVPEYTHFMKQYKRIIPEDSQQFRDLYQEVEILKQEQRVLASLRPKAECTNPFCITNHDQCEGCGGALEHAVGGVLGFAGNVGSAFLRGVFGGFGK